MLRIIISAILVLSPMSWAQNDRVSRILDLRVLQRSLNQDSEFRLELPLLQEFAIHEGAEDEKSDEGGFAELEELLELLRNQQILDLEGEDSLDLHQEGVVVIRAEAARAQKALDFLDRCQRMLLRSATLEIYPLDRQAFASLPRSRLSSAACEDFLKAWPTLSPSVHQLRLGRRENLKSSFTTSIVGDYDVQVAKKAAIPKPVIRALFQGLDFSLVVDQRLDGRFQVNVASRAAQRLDANQPRRIKPANLEWLELPRCEAQLLRVSGDLELGGALVVGDDSPDGRSYLLRLKTADTLGDQDPKLMAYSLGDLTRRLRRQGLPYIPKPGISSHDCFCASEDSDEESQAAIDSESVYELICQGGIYNGDFNGYVMAINGTFWVAAPEEVQQIVQNTIRDLSRPLQKSIDYEVRWGFIDAEEFTTMARSPLESWVSKLENRSLLCSRVGDIAMSVTGQESVYIRDKDVEVAEDSRIADPLTDTTFAGIAMRLFSGHGLDGQVALNAQFMIQTLKNEPVEIPTNIDEIGSIDSVSGQRLVAHPRLLLKTNQWNLMMASRVAGSSKIAVVALRLN